MTWSYFMLVAVTGIVVSVAIEVARRQWLKSQFGKAKESDLMERFMAKQDLRVDLGPEDRDYLCDTVVFVTGAGSSIAGELIQTLIREPVSSIVLVDNHENALYRVRQQLVESGLLDGKRLYFELANVRDVDRLTALYEQYKPNITFHFANYKSALLGNITPYAFVKVNIEGTQNLLKAASQCTDMFRFVYVSSDKAHSATQTYGRTKLLGEMLVAAEARRNSRIKFACIRYCNVLDAAGSFAIPTFRRQISHRQKLTIRRFADGTIPDRFFIPIDTAAKLTLLCGSLAGDGNVFSLDSNRVQAIPIDRLARELARRYGVRFTDWWVRSHVEYVAAERGEKPSEILGSGRPLSIAPLVELEAHKMHDVVLFERQIQELIVQCSYLTADELGDRVTRIVNSQPRQITEQLDLQRHLDKDRESSRKMKVPNAL